MYCPLAEYGPDQLCKDYVAGAKIERDEHDDDNDNLGCRDGLFAGRPGDLGQFRLYILDESLGFTEHLSHPTASELK